MHEPDIILWLNSIETTFVVFITTIRTALIGVQVKI